jgi:multiple sugar transport system permease protein
MTIQRTLWRGFLYLCMLIVAVAVFAPLIWLGISSISSRAELLETPPHWIPHKPTLQNYKDLLMPDQQASRTAQGFRYAMRNSLIVASSVAVISLFFGILAAYAFARLDFPLRRTGLVGYMSLRMLPGVSVIIPLYVLLRDGHSVFNLVLGQSNLLNTQKGLILVYLSFTLPFVIYVMSSFFQSLPTELEDAARVDGCTRLGALWRIILPVARPGLVATGVFAFLLAWDEFFFALLLTSTPAAKTIPVVITEFTGRHSTDFSAQAAGGILAAAPPVLLALIFQRYIVRGLTAGAVKG